MSLYPCRMGGGSGDTGTEVTLTLPTSGSTQAKLLGNANTIYLMSNLFNATTFFTTYINGVMKTNEISTIYGTGENWGVSVGRLTGDFKKGDIVTLAPANGLALPASVTMVAFMKAE